MFQCTGETWSEALFPDNIQTIKSQRPYEFHCHHSVVQRSISHKKFHTLGHSVLQVMTGFFYSYLGFFILILP
jgi:hypothetical protein